MENALISSDEEAPYMHYKDEVSCWADSSGAVLLPEAENSSMSMLSIPEMVKSQNK